MFCKGYHMLLERNKGLKILNVWFDLNLQHIMTMYLNQTHLDTPRDSMLSINDLITSTYVQSPANTLSHKWSTVYFKVEVDSWSRPSCIFSYNASNPSLCDGLLNTLKVWRTQQMFVDPERFGLSQPFATHSSCLLSTFI